MDKPRRSAFCFALTGMQAFIGNGVCVAQDVRQTLPLSAGWRFHFGAVAGDASAPAFDDGGWQQVSVPHTWNRLGEYSLTRSGATNNKRGTGWYRLQFVAPNAHREQRHYLKFEAVGTVADGWLNDVRCQMCSSNFCRRRSPAVALDSIKPERT